MDEFLFAAFKGSMVVLFVVISTAMLYHRLFRRWLRFSFVFILVYAVGAYAFFGKADLPLPAGVLVALPHYLFFFGSFGVLGISLIRGYTLAQSIGVLACYQLGVLTLLFLAGRMTPAEIKGWIAMTTLLMFLVGLPAVVGYARLQSLDKQQTLGAIVIFLAFLAAVMVVVDLTIGYKSIQPIVAPWKPLFSGVSDWVRGL